MSGLRAELKTAFLFTVVTTIALGIVYPLLVTLMARLLFPDQANGSLLSRGETHVGSRLLAQPFTGERYFHPRPSAAGADGFDPLSSGPSNAGPTSQKLVDRVREDVASAQKDTPGRPVPIDLVTTSGSGLDPHISPLGALYQLERVAKARNLKPSEVRRLVDAHTEGRQFGLFGEPRVNVLDLNLDLDRQHPGVP
jgi:K+-transporting ATPase ATPase C chain